MTARPLRWPASDLDVVAELRRQLDEYAGKRLELERQIQIRDDRLREYQQAYREVGAERDALRATLLGEAELAESQSEPHEKRGSAWWYACWREVSRHRAELHLRVQSLERWIKEAGAEAARLQRVVSARDQEIGELSRQLDLAREGERPGDDQGDDVDEDAPTVIPTGEEIH